MTKMIRAFCILGVAALTLTGCPKSEETAKPDEAALAAEEAAKAAEAALAAEEAAKAEAAAAEEAAKAAAAAADADFIKLMATHEPTTEADPVMIMVEKYAVTKAEYDPANLEGATAELELDLSSIKSDNPKRDGHLQSPDYLDVAKFGTATVKIADVKKGEGEAYTAQAEVTAHGMTKTFPVSFEVVEATEEGLRIKAEHKFSRLDFGIGKTPDGENEKVATDVTAQMQLTLKNTK